MRTTDVTDLARGLQQFLATGNLPGGVLADDVFADLNVPVWRFQAQGADAFAGMLEEYTDIEAEAGRCEPTASGFVQESVIRAVKHNGERVYSRQVFLAIVRDGRIAEITMYCTGDWDEATVARQAAEAPMLRS